MDKPAPTLILAALALALALPCRAGEPEAELKKAGREAHERIDEARERRVEARQELERLKKDLRYISEELDREVLDQEANKGLSAYSKGGLERLENLEKRGSIDPKLKPALERLEKLYRELPQKEYAAEYANSLVKAVTEELRRIAEDGKSVDEILRMLDEELALPDSLDAAPGKPGVLGFFPEDVPLEKFKKLGIIKTFLMKHRIKRPKTHVRTTAPDIVAGQHNVQIGVEVEGTVTGVYNAFDMDYCFDIGSLHVEMTPEWRLTHPRLVKPKVGQKVRFKGWTYYDKFHKTELEYDPEDPVMGINRVTLWEVHPVQDVELLP